MYKMYTYIYIYIHICIYKQRERKRERERAEIAEREREAAASGGGRQYGLAFILWGVAVVGGISRPVLLSSDLISHKMVSKSFGKSQFPHKPVTLFFILGNSRGQVDEVLGE